MNTNFAILTIGAVPVDDVTLLLAEHIPEQQIKHVSLIGGMSREEALAEYGYWEGNEAGDAPLYTAHQDRDVICLSRKKVERTLRDMVQLFDRQGTDVILLISSTRFENLVASNALLLESERIIPSLVASIVEGHQVGVMVPVPELRKGQEEKWRVLENKPFFALADPLNGGDQQLLNAGRELIKRGADVIVLDCAGFRQKHRDLLQKELDVPVLLSTALVVRLASELLVS